MIRACTRLLTVAALAAAVLGSTVHAQETRGTIGGTVKDPSGGVLPGMTVLITNEETSVSNQAVTTDRGTFEFPYLLPGTYVITVQADGFRKFTRRGIALSVNSRLDLPIVLEVGALND
jgi:hypothetical protein